MAAHLAAAPLLGAGVEQQHAPPAAVHLRHPLPLPALVARALSGAGMEGSVQAVICRRAGRQVWAGGCEQAGMSKQV